MVEPIASVFRNLQGMQQIYSWSWVEAQVAQCIEVWNSGAARPVKDGPRYGLRSNRSGRKHTTRRCGQWNVR